MLANTAPHAEGMRVLPQATNDLWLLMRSYDPDPRIATAEWARPPVETLQ